MKHFGSRILCLLLGIMLVLAISGCTGSQVRENDPSSDFRFLDLEWGITPKALCTELKLSEDDYVYAVYEEEHRLQVGDVHLDAFGADAQITFGFFDADSDGEYCLYQVKLYYPADVDMQGVKASVSAQYGKPTEESERKAVWNSGALIQDYMSEEDKAMAERHGDAAQRMALKPVTTITWTDSYGFPAVYEDSETKNVLTFSSEAAMYTREGGYAARYAQD